MELYVQPCCATSPCLTYNCWVASVWHELPEVCYKIYSFQHKSVTNAVCSKPPISSRLLSSGLESEVTVATYCDYCVDSTQPADFQFADGLYDEYSNSWLGFALDTFDAAFEVEIDLSEATSDNLTLSLRKISVEFDDVVLEVDFQLYLIAETSASMSFTAGLNLSVSC